VDAYQMFHEARGSLLPVELFDVPFPVRRVFVVAGPPGGADRGDHPAPCGEEVVLISGSVHFTIIDAEGSVTDEFVLDEPGQRVVLRRGEHVRYRLPDERSRILVLAEEPYVGGLS
jgi:hypothetical protein